MRHRSKQDHRHALHIFAWACLTDARAKRKKNWAHQDSNLERAGYEPAALTVELWARSIVTKSACGRCQATECSPALARPPSNSARGWGRAAIKKCWLAAFSQHSSVRMGPHPHALTRCARRPSGSPPLRGGLRERSTFVLPGTLSACANATDAAVCAAP